MFRVKIDDFTSLQSCAILPSKMVFPIARPKYHVTRSADVIWVPEDQYSIAESKASKGLKITCALSSLLPSLNVCEKSLNSDSLDMSSRSKNALLSVELQCVNKLLAPK